ncbi:hypothetical protein PAPYR_12918 [Paratrimastix pyriformis]|uniref:Uncharacterized protein n=1 Tax=Paratrimastix pyriformis TaxID=342808 RepID=A0ABQ8U3K1_9EUKA|nr:hypothetical protein PAPYR_12918 [Paratrimastix pyriformis]
MSPPEVGLINWAAAAQQVQPCGLHTPLDLHLPPSWATSGSTRGNFFASMPPFHGSSSGTFASDYPVDHSDNDLQNCLDHRHILRHPFQEYHLHRPLSISPLLHPSFLYFHLDRIDEFFLPSPTLVLTLTIYQKHIWAHPSCFFHFSLAKSKD